MVLEQAIQSQNTADFHENSLQKKRKWRIYVNHHNINGQFVRLLKLLLINHLRIYTNEPV